MSSSKFSETMVVIKRMVTGGRKGESFKGVDALPVSPSRRVEVAGIRHEAPAVEPAPSEAVEQLVVPVEVVPAAELVSPQPIAAPEAVETPAAASLQAPAQLYNAALEAKAKELEAELATCSAVLGKLSGNVGLWDMKQHVIKVTEAKGQFDKARTGVNGLLGELVKEANQTQDASEKLQEREKLLLLTKDQEAALQRSFQLHTHYAAKMRGMLTKINSEKLNAKEARGAAGGRFGITGSEDTLQMLCDSVDAMAEDNQELVQSNSQLERANADLTKRIKEIQDKARNDMEIKEREMKELRAALKKANEEKQSGMGAAKEQVSAQLAKKTTEIKALQRRTEVAKNEAEQAKAQGKAMKISLDQATAALAKSEEETKALVKKVQDAKLHKDNMARDLENAKAEQEMIFAELRQLQAAAPAAKCNPAHCNKEAGWPRIAYTARGGKVLHNSACGNMDTSKCVTFQYENVKELESYMQEEGVVLCHACRADPGF